MTDKEIRHIVSLNTNRPDYHWHGLDCSLDDPVILNWPERIKTQPHDDRDNYFLPFDSKGPCSMTVNNDIVDDSATKHSDSHTRNSHRQSV